ncbi:RluA family pseudouridine synthase [Roseateles saccharophilus]|uniref:Pseudouridine synthase n=1 Tax=Roseateles saccharophilus TaxID=304 RepID=A0A4R3UJ10_ROSSA|nr:RluA family pseudouridine synthase [Roseateles saccharophilus]MDG0833799.1 RluA family pseudouridine synthase [Roseateles saccharophilus]TCU91575.1 ribosomal large subunit pseudouridine synthase D [Roseateles saccharophilus]
MVAKYRAGGLDDPEDEAGEVAAAESAAERRVAEVDAAGHGERLDRWLTGLAPEFSRNHLQSLIERGCVLVDGRALQKAAHKLRAGQRVEIELQPTDESRAFRAEPMALDLAFEDEHLLVVNKPAGLVVHPAPGNWSGTLMNGLLAHHPAAASLPRAGIVHRLDKDTSGLMVVGKTLEAVTALTRQIAAREVHREYLALAWGRVEEAFVVEKAMRRDPVSRVKMAVAPANLGKPARTDVFPLGVGDVQGRPVSAVHCVLHTGRTHQIRVHLMHSGHPLLADALYGGAPALGLSRQALHAARLGFTHPITGAAITLVAALPADLASAWAGIGAADLPG